MNKIDKGETRDRIFSNLEDYGIQWDKENERLICEDFKDSQYKLSRKTNPHPSEYKHKIQDYLAKREDIDLAKVDPYIVITDSGKSAHYNLWAYATSLWSVPVTQGFGRRIRYFVFDKQNDKLIGIVGLSDPLIGLGIRDTNSIGWSVKEKMNRLYNCMTAYILGAIPPYNSILGSKLIALTVSFPEIRDHFFQKYQKSAEEKGKLPNLVYVDTLGAFGKSSIYTRLKGWEFVGYTKGQSHIHITANGSWELFRKVLPEEVFKSYEYGDGPNWKMRVLKKGLQELDLSYEMLSIGWKRGYYRLPLIENWQDFLNHKTDKVQYLYSSKSSIIDYWKNRWLYPRKEKLQEKLNNFQ